MKVDITNLIKYPSQASEDLGAIDICDDQDIDACIEKVMTINEETNFEELLLDKSTLELKPLPSTIKYTFLDTQKSDKLVIISSQLDQALEK